MAQTPIKRIVYYGCAVFAEDYSGQCQMVAKTNNPEDAKWLAWSLGAAHNVPHVEQRLDIRETADSTIDATTARMMLETGHECEVDSIRVRDLLATVHNFIGSFRAWRKGTEDHSRLQRKFHEMTQSHEKIQKVSEQHFENMNKWRP